MMDVTIMKKYKQALIVLGVAVFLYFLLHLSCMIFFYRSTTLNCDAPISIKAEQTYKIDSEHELYPYLVEAVEELDYDGFLSQRPSYFPNNTVWPVSKNEIVPFIIYIPVNGEGKEFLCILDKDNWPLIKVKNYEKLSGIVEDFITHQQE